MSDEELPQEQERWRVTIVWGPQHEPQGEQRELTVLTWRPAGRSPLEVVVIVCAERGASLEHATEVDVAQTGDRRVLHRP